MHHGDIVRDPATAQFLSESKVQRDYNAYANSPRGQYESALRREIEARERRRKHDFELDKEYFEKFGVPRQAPRTIAIDKKDEQHRP